MPWPPERLERVKKSSFPSALKVQEPSWYWVRMLGEKLTLLVEVYTPEGGKGNEFTHTERIVLVDQDGKIRGFYNGLDKQMMDTFYNNLASILVGIPQQ